MADIDLNFLLPDGFARLNITFNGGNGDLLDPVRYDANDADLRTMATEAIRNGSVPGVTAGNLEVALGDFVVDRFPATPEVQVPRIFIRPKTPFGA